LLSIIYPYRNRESGILKKSLDSLKNQSNLNFEVFLVDYGSGIDNAKSVREMCEKFNFVQYQYEPTFFQPWNKSRAINLVIKKLTNGFCFVADVDMIFHPSFVEKAALVQKAGTTTYFQVGFLEKEETDNGNAFYDFKKYRQSTYEATGMSMFPVNCLKEIRGFDEFYHFWGAEDTDIHVRLRNAGYIVEFYDSETLLLHQWHKSYRSKEVETLTSDYQIKGIVQLNHFHLKFAKENNIRKVNHKGWGKVTREKDIKELIELPTTLSLTNRKEEINDFLYGQLPGCYNKTIKIRIVKDAFEGSVKYRIKKILRHRVSEYYDLKQVNDKILLHLISHYRNVPYTYRINRNLNEIEFALKL